MYLRGTTSLIGKLKAKFPDINIYDYVSLNCLRNWAIINEKIVSDQIYIHDKIIIVDDLIAIIGSANLNDRSLLGNRDSEVIYSFYFIKFSYLYFRLRYELRILH